VQYMPYMFESAAFNQDISTWTVSSVTTMEGMFFNASSFNQTIGSWNVSSVTNMISMFNNAFSFNQNLGAWTLNNSVDMSGMLNSCGVSTENYSKTLIGWANEAFSSGTPTARTLGATGRTYNSTAYSGTPYDTAGGADSPPVGARAYLVGTKGWTITGDAAV